MTHTHTHT